MRAKQKISILLAGAMMAGSIGMISPIQAKAEGSSTKVTLGVPTKNDYTMVVPSDTEMNHDGSAKELTSGLTIKGTAMTKDVVVKLTESHDWKLVSDDATTEIGYGVYASATSTDKITEIEFTTAEIMKTNSDGQLIGTTKDLFVKPDATDLANADGGNYSGTITFTAEFKADAPATVTVAGFSIKATDGQTWAEIAANNENVIIDEVRNWVKIDGNYIADAGTGIFATATGTFSASATYIIA